MIYIIKHITVRTKKEVNKIYHYLFGNDFYDISDEEYDGEEIISSRDELVKIYDDHFELNINDGINGKRVFDMSKYRVELCCKRNLIILDMCDEVLDPESYSEYCKQDGDEIRIYYNRTGRLVDAYRYEISDIREVADRIDNALRDNILGSNFERRKHEHEKD